MKMRFKREGKNLVVSVSHELDINTKTFELEHVCERESWAELIKNRMNKLLEERLREIRHTAYEDGYRDGRAHKKKLTYFYPSLQARETGM